MFKYMLESSNQKNSKEQLKAAAANILIYSHEKTKRTLKNSTTNPLVPIEDVNL